MCGQHVPGLNYSSCVVINMLTLQSCIDIMYNYTYNIFINQDTSLSTTVLNRRDFIN